MDQETQTAETSTFAGRLKKARQDKGLTQAQLGEGLGRDSSDLGKGAVSAWEVGSSEPSPAQLLRICNRLGVSADYLLGTDKAEAVIDPRPTLRLKHRHEHTPHDKPSP